MGLLRDTLSGAIEIIREEIVPLRHDLIKAGILKPDQNAFDAKASLVDPWAQSNSTFGYKEKFSILDYSKCRQISYADPVVAAVIQTRLNQAAAFATPQNSKYSIGFKVKMRDDEGRPTPAVKKRVYELEQFIMNCGVPENFEDTPEIKRRDSFETFLRKVVRDTLTFDQVNFEITPRRNGQPYAFQAVDASTIRVIQDKRENIEQMGGAGNFVNNRPVNLIVNDRTEDVFNYFKPKNPRYAQVINGSIAHVFDEWEMAFGIRNPRTDILANGYGFSEIEMLITTITSHMNAETYNRKFFSQGSSVKGVITFEGSVPPDQLEAFRRQWYQQVSGVNNAWKTPILALGKEGKMNWVSLHSTNKEMEFGKWLEYCIKTICGVFQIDPIEIGFDISKQTSGTGGSGGLGNGSQEERLQFSQDKGLRPLLKFIQSLINDYIIWRIDPNFEFEFVGLNGETEKEALDKQERQVKTFKTVNEVRAENDLEPIKTVEDLKKMNLGDIILDPQFMQLLTAQGTPDQEQGQPGEGMPGEEGGEASEEGGEEEEPDYANMSDEELQAELGKLQGEGGPPAAPKNGMPGKKQAPGIMPSGASGQGASGALSQPSAAPMEKSFFRELEL